MGLSAYQVPPVTARPELDLKGNAVKYTSYSEASVTENKSKYQCGLSLMKHPVSRHHQAERSDISELITTTIFLWCFCKVNILLVCLLFNSYVENESTLNFKGMKTLLFLFSSPKAVPKILSINHLFFTFSHMYTL